MKKLCISTIASLIATPVLAAAPAPTKISWLPAGYSWVGTLSVGAAWEHAGQSQTFYLNPGTQKTYTASRPTDFMPQGEVFFGIQTLLRDHLTGQIGLNFVAASDARPEGDIWDDANPTFNNYSYNYKITHNSLGIKGKLLIDNGYWFIPWISASVGFSYNKAYAYGNAPNIYQAVENADFTSNYASTLTYTLGVGAQHAINNNWQVGLGYEFSDWGKSQLGRAQRQTLNQGLTLNHLYTNSIQFNITSIS